MDNGVITMNKHKVAIIMGSQSDWPVLRQATILLEEFGIPFEAMVVSAHRTPQRLYEFTKSAEDNYSVIIAGAGGAASPAWNDSSTHLCSSDWRSCAKQSTQRYG